MRREKILEACVNIAWRGIAKEELSMLGRVIGGCAKNTVIEPTRIGAIYATTDGDTGAITVTNSGTATATSTGGASASGIYATTGGAISITNSGSTSASSSGQAAGIHAVGLGGLVTVDN